MELNIIAAIFIGSGIGGVLRYIIIHKLNSTSIFPLGTLLVNVLACFIIGYIAGCNPLKISPLAKKFWIVGFCGGFSTFSAFANENYLLFQNNKFFFNVLYIVLTNIFCIMATFMGYFWAKP